ncbi:MAG: decaprenyl-phosphate phosphoribosyltransferase [Dehalococcoidia bacterium]|nr:decaprenyl-phosphate phosphoribosyltransferase [Dehalococcoidia bacterium]
MQTESVMAQPALGRDLLVSLRPKQWAKNSLVFLALLFSANERWSFSDVAGASLLIWQSLAAFVLFSIVASAQYLANDVIDADRDSHHPRKRHRPIASGRVSRSLALTVAAVLAVGGLAGSFALAPLFALLLAGYLSLMVAYSLSLKHVVIVDVFVIAAGFVLRATGGALAIAVPISPWLYLCTMLGALFLGFAKRRNELAVLRSGAAEHRRILDEYTDGFLDQMINVVAASTLIAYSFYTFSAPNLPSNHAMMLTIPFVLYGIFRYLYLIHVKGLGGSPEEVLFSDRPLVAGIVGWVAVSAAVLLVFRGT